MLSSANSVSEFGRVLWTCVMCPLHAGRFPFEIDVSDNAIQSPHRMLLRAHRGVWMWSSTAAGEGITPQAKHVHFVYLLLRSLVFGAPPPQPSLLRENQTACACVRSRGEDESCCSIVPRETRQTASGTYPPASLCVEARTYLVEHVFNEAPSTTLKAFFCWCEDASLPHRTQRGRVTVGSSSQYR